VRLSRPFAEYFDDVIGDYRVCFAFKANKGHSSIRSLCVRQLGHPEKGQRVDEEQWRAEPARLAHCIRNREFSDLGFAGFRYHFASMMLSAANFAAFRVRAPLPANLRYTETLTNYIQQRRDSKHSAGPPRLVTI
jgi:hypothetical protein